MNAERSPAVTAVLTIYNKERYVDRAVRSVLAQTFTDWELVMVDDGSTDASPRIVAPYIGERIRYIHQENRGPSAARNRAVRDARGEYIAFIDADDEWHPRHLERMVDFARRHPEAGAVFCGVADTKDGVVTMPAEAALGPGVTEGLIPNWFRSKRYGYYAVDGFLAARAKMLEVGLPADGIRCWDDSEFFGRLVLRWPAGYIAEVLTYYHREAEGRVAASPLASEFPPVVHMLRKALAAGAVAPDQRDDAREYIAKLLLTHAEHLLGTGRRLAALRVLLFECRTRWWAARRRGMLRAALVPGWLRRLRRAVAPGRCGKREK
jgi:glycosyltransferase involved in cell wall biosynthesis